jgi:hypothetical protein
MRSSRLMLAHASHLPPSNRCCCLAKMPGIMPGMLLSIALLSFGLQQGPGGFVHKDHVLPSCTLSGGCLADPAMRTVSSLPGGTSAPNTEITENAVRTYHLQTQLNGWLIQAPAPLTAAVMFGDVPVADVLILLLGLPLIAAASGWLVAGREPPAVARQPID